MHQRELTPEVLTFIESCNVRELKALAKVPDRDNPLYTLMTRSYTLMLCLYRRLSRILVSDGGDCVPSSTVLLPSVSEFQPYVHTVLQCTPMHANTLQYTVLYCNR
jgi:hypothetical protein